ncbi:MAG: NADH-quinone oxidoreductase subunit J [Gemmataceae bacterium]
MDLHVVFFWIMAIWSGVCAIGVVVTQNIVRAATWLLFALAGVAGIFFLLGADFVAASQLLIYVGGTLVLVVFGVMLTAQGPFVNLKTGAVEWATSLVVGTLLFGVLAVTLFLFRPTLQPDQSLMNDPVDSPNAVVLGEAMLGYPEATPDAEISGMPKGAYQPPVTIGARDKGKAKDVDPAKAPPKRKQIAYLLPFEIVSVHLLVVLIGAAYLARARRRRETAVS